MDTPENLLIQLETLKQENLNLKQELKEIKEEESFIIKTYNNTSEESFSKDNFKNPFQMSRLIIETANEGIWVCDKEARTIYVNQRMTELLGYSYEEMVGKLSFEFVDPKERHVSESKFEKRLSGLIDRYEQKLVCKDGSTIWVSAAASPLKDKEGNVIATLGMVTNITESKNIRKALEASEEKFSAAFNSNPNALALSRVEDGTIIDVNQTFLSLFELDRDEIMEKTSLSLNLFEHPEEREKAISMLTQEGRLRNYEINVKCKTGKVKTVLLSVDYIKSGNQKIC